MWQAASRDQVSNHRRADQPATASGVRIRFEPREPPAIGEVVPPVGQKVWRRMAHGNAAGFVGVRFTPANDFGVLDHAVMLPDGQSVMNPMRLVANGEGSEVMFTLLQLPGMSDEQFALDTGMVEADLRTLKVVVEEDERPS